VEQRAHLEEEQLEVRDQEEAERGDDGEEHDRVDHGHRGAVAEGTRAPRRGGGGRPPGSGAGGRGGGGGAVGRPAVVLERAEELDEAAALRHRGVAWRPGRRVVMGEAGEGGASAVWWGRRDLWGNYRGDFADPIGGAGECEWELLGTAVGTAPLRGARADETTTSGGGLVGLVWLGRRLVPWRTSRDTGPGPCP